jgi:hypothetical protein
LGGGVNNLKIDHAAVSIDRDDAISAGTQVTVDGGAAAFQRPRRRVGDLTLLGNSQAHVAALANTAPRLLPARSPPPRSSAMLTIGSASGAAADAVAANPAARLP